MLIIFGTAKNPDMVFDASEYSLHVPQHNLVYRFFDPLHVLFDIRRVRSADQSCLDFGVAQGKLHSECGNIRSLAATVRCGFCASFAYVFRSGMPGRQLMGCKQTLGYGGSVDDFDSLLSQPWKQACQSDVVQRVVVIRKDRVNFGGGKDSAKDFQRIASDTYKACLALFLDLPKGGYGFIDYLIQISVLIVVRLDDIYIIDSQPFETLVNTCRGSLGGKIEFSVAITSDFCCKKIPIARNSLEGFA